MRLDSWPGSLRLACRNAARRPGFTTIVVLTLALGIGVNSAVFALLDGVLLRPLPYRDPARLVFLWQTLPQHGVFELEATPFDYAEWRTLRSFDGVALVATGAFTISDDNPERLRGARVSASLMPLLGIAPRAGRTFTADEDDQAAAPVAILSNGLWRRRFAADPAAVGQSIRINGITHTIVGILPATAILPGPLATSSDIWLPMRMTPDERVNDSSHNYTVVARLAPGVSQAAASAELQSLAARLAAARPDTHKIAGARLVGLEEQTVRGIRPALLVVAGGVALLLLAACANAAALIVARAAGRSRDSAVREALGATASDLLEVAVSESFVYFGLGAVAGLVLSAGALRTLVPLFADSLPPGTPVEIGARVVLFTAAIAGALAMVCGVISARRPHAPAEALKAATRTVGSAAGRRTRTVLVAAQTAFAVMLLAAAWLLTSSFVKLSRVKPGFDIDRVLSFRLSLSDSGYHASSLRIAAVESLLQQLRGIPGVDDAGIVSMIPFGGARGADAVEIAGRPSRRGEPVIIDQRHITPSYFATMRIPLLRGRPLLGSDDQLAERVVVINRRMAEMYWPGASPLDARLRVAGGITQGAWFRIVGVVENVRHVSLTREAVPEMYYSYAQAPVGNFSVVVRTAADPAAIVPAVRLALRSVDRRLPMYDVRTMTERVATSFAQTRATMWLLLATAGLAGSLAATAIYGSIWYAVSHQAPEIGIRITLGATGWRICRAVIGEALATTALGCAVGLGAAYAARPALAGLLFQTPAADVHTYGLVFAALFAVTVVAAIGPAVRAMRIDPVVALRDE